MSNLKSKIKVVFLGEQSTGKTSILTRFIEDKFEIGIGPTVGIDFMAKSVVAGGQVLRLQFWDTAGQQRFRSLIPNYLKEAYIAFLVFDLSNDKSFANLPEWIDLCNQNMGQKCVTILLGNKCDLDERQVSAEEVQARVSEYGLKYFECSAKTGHNIKQSLNYACEDLLRLNKKQTLNSTQNSQDQSTKEKGAISLSSQNISSNQKSQGGGSRCC